MGCSFAGVETAGHAASEARESARLNPSQGGSLSCDLLRVLCKELLRYMAGSCRGICSFRGSFNQRSRQQHMFERFCLLVCEVNASIHRLHSCSKSAILSNVSDSSSLLFFRRPEDTRSVPFASAQVSPLPAVCCGERPIRMPCAQRARRRAATSCGSTCAACTWPSEWNSSVRSGYPSSEASSTRTTCARPPAPRATDAFAPRAT
eukprot:6211849-Pleurochrysis_carterae.AAC.7